MPLVACKASPHAFIFFLHPIVCPGGVMGDDEPAADSPVTTPSHFAFMYRPDIL